MPGTWAKTGWNGVFLMPYASMEELETEFCTIILENRGNFSASGSI